MSPIEMSWTLLDYVRHTIVAPILIFLSTPATILLRFGFHQTKYQLVFERYEVEVKIPRSRHYKDTSQFSIQKQKPLSNSL